MRLKGLVQYEAQTINELLVKVLSEERQVIHTVIKRPLHTVLDELLCQIHILLDLEESYFGLQSSRTLRGDEVIGVLRTERWPEGVDTPSASAAISPSSCPETVSDVWRAKKSSL